MNDLNFSMRQIQGIAILDLDGRIEIGEGSSELRLNLHSLVTERKRRVILNLGRVRAIDSYGLGTLVAGYATMERSGGRLVLMNLSPKIAELMTITNLNNVFDIFDDEGEAICSFSRPAGRIKRPPASRSARINGGSSIL